MSVKKILAACLAVLLSFSLLLSVSAAGADDSEAAGAQEEASALFFLGLMKGVSTTEVDFALDNPLTREQGVILVIRLLGMEETVLAANVACPFDDVPEWAAPYIGWAYENGITNGISADKFGYGKPLSDAMFLTFTLRVLGYSDSGADAEFSWDDPYDLAADCGLTDGDPDSSFTRGDSADVCFRALAATLPSGKTLAEYLIEQGVFTEDEYDTAVAIAEGEVDYTPSLNDEDRDETIVEGLKSTLYAKAAELETYYTAAITDLFNQASDKYTTLSASIGEDAAYDSVRNEYLPQGQALEAECDAAVAALLADYTERLSQYTDDLSAIADVQAQYDAKKAAKKDQFRSFLG